MNRFVKRGLQITAVSAAAIVVCSTVVVTYLAYTGTPSKSRFMTFEGYIELPKSGLLNVLDYLTIDGRTLFVTSESSGTLFKISLDPNRPSASSVSELPGTGAAHGVALLPADAILYVPSVKLMYVANGDAHLATLIDPVKRTIVGAIKLPGKPEFPALDPKTGLLYQNLEDINSIAAIDLGKRSVVGQWSIAPCEGPSGMAIDSEQRRLFAVCSGNAMLVVFDLESHRIITALRIGGGPDSVAFDPPLHRIYTAGKAGKLTVIQQDGPDAYRVLDEIHTHYGAHTLTVDTVSHKVFVAYASLLAHPRIAVFSPAL